jgi:hypothetical protein
MLAEALRADHNRHQLDVSGGGPNATLSVEEGADTAIWLAEEATHELTGILPQSAGNPLVAALVGHIDRRVQVNLRILLTSATPTHS